MTIDAAHRLLAQMGTNGEGEVPVASHDVAGQAGQAVLIAIPLLLSVRMVVVPVGFLKMTRSVIFDSLGVVQVDYETAWLA